MLRENFDFKTKTISHTLPFMRIFPLIWINILPLAHGGERSWTSDDGNWVEENTR